ncbi:uncharacterized protein ASCRUDRAFT_152804 [Ascoidea rubescens DSM 1968]|uniref:Uncharacterized protein n=1 Tax=Ascoidea rubescens DSM 1968 TaxID=1344418 RepID=A0A1D2VFH4_9ASCO|nr:hypothetical protein ASCRUDRAFT_152804 [Ascoidea rubescens DSM 1968]ODV60263.1 hypothetical protein ASCRUDRAFT_152804 [Ascoidea rubescens DSM 1968]
MSKLPSKLSKIYSVHFLKIIYIIHNYNFKISPFYSQIPLLLNPYSTQPSILFILDIIIIYSYNYSILKHSIDL